MEDNPKPPEENPPPSSTGGADTSETALGTTQNIAGLLTYILFWGTGIVFLLIEKDNKFVRFHAMQSIVIFVPLTVASVVVGFLPIFGGLLSTLVYLATIGIWLLMMFQAFQNKWYKFPYAGEYAETQLKNMGSE